MKRLLLIFLVGLIGIGIIYVVKGKTTGLTTTSQVTTNNSIVESTNEPILEANQNQNNVIEIFFQNISEKKIPEAIAIMTNNMVSDDSTKQAWGVQFAAFKKVKLLSIEPSMKETWTATSELYKVTLDVEMTPESVNGPIPYYGYEQGNNIRWIQLEKEDGEWKIAGINTGP